MGHPDSKRKNCKYHHCKEKYRSHKSKSKHHRCKSNSGSTGPMGPTGPKGDTGDVGIQGPRGCPGMRGSKGCKGDSGATGATGANGATGTFDPATLCSVLGNPGVVLDCISNVDISDPVTGDYLYYDGNNSQWINQPVSNAKNVLGSQGNNDPSVDVSNPTDGDSWVNSTSGKAFIYQEGAWTELPCVVQGGSSCNQVALACGEVSLLQPPNDGITGPLRPYTFYQGAPSGNPLLFWDMNPEINNLIIHTTSVQGPTGSIPISPIGVDPVYDLSTIVITEIPTCGTLSAVSAGDPFVTYIPDNPGSPFVDIFTYSIDRNTSCGSITETVKEFISQCINPGPYANNNRATTYVSSTNAKTISLNVLDNDLNIMGLPTVKYNGDVAPGGTVTVDSGTQIVDFTPVVGLAGTYTFTYNVTGTNGTTNNATVTIDTIYNPFFCISPARPINLVFSLDISTSVSDAEYIIYKQALEDAMSTLRNLQSTSPGYSFNTTWISFDTTANMRSPGTFDNPTYLNVVDDQAAISAIIQGMPYNQPLPRYTNWPASVQAFHVLSGAATTPDALYFITDGAPNMIQSSPVTWGNSTVSTGETFVTPSVNFNLDTQTCLDNANQYITNYWGATPTPQFNMIGVDIAAIVNPPQDGPTYFASMGSTYDAVAGVPSSQYFTSLDWTGLSAIISNAIEDYCF